MSAAFLDLVDLASERLGAAVVSANDEFFAAKENLIKPEAPVWIEGRYTERGKWMDGWETRRRRDAGHDWAILRLGVPGVVRGVDVDTAFFKGNFPEACAIDVCDAPAAGAGGSRARRLARGAAAHRRSTGDAHNHFAVAGAPRRRTCACGSFRTAASRACASTATSSPTGRVCACAATSISPPSNTAASSSAAATCSSDRATI